MPRGRPKKVKPRVLPERRIVGFRLVHGIVRAWTYNVFLGDQWEEFIMSQWRVFVYTATQLQAVTLYELDVDEDEVFLPNNITHNRFVNKW